MNVNLVTMTKKIRSITNELSHYTDLSKHLPHVFKRYLDLSVFNVIQTMHSIFSAKCQQKSSTTNGINR